MPGSPGFSGARGGSVMDSWRQQGYQPQIAVQPQQQQGQMAPQSEPHWWDTAMATVGPWLNPFKEGAKIAEEHGAQGVANVLNPIGSAEDAIMGTVQKGVDLVSHVASTGLQAAVVWNPLYKDGVQLSDFGAMWDHAQTLSPGQAGVYFGAQYYGRIAEAASDINEVVRNPTAGHWADATVGQGTIMDPGFDIYANEKALQDNNFWNLGTGAEDVLFQLAGTKGVGTLIGAGSKVAGLKNAAMNGRDLGVARDAIDSHMAAKMGESTFTSAVDGSAQATKANFIGQHVERLAASKNISEIMQNPLVAGSQKQAQLAAIIRDTNDFDVVKELVLADHGDRFAISRLIAGGNGDRVWQLTNMNEGLAKALGDGLPLSAKTEKMLASTFDGAISRDANAKTLYDTFIETGDDGRGLAFTQNNTNAIKGLNYGEGKVGQALGDTKVAQAAQRTVGGFATVASEARIGAQMGVAANALQDGAVAADRALAYKPLRYTLLSNGVDGSPRTILAKFLGADSAPTGGARMDRLTAGRRALNMVTLSGMRANDVVDEISAYMNGVATRKLTEVTIHAKDKMGMPTSVTQPIEQYRAGILADLANHVGDETVTQAIVARVERDMISSVAKMRGIDDHEIVKPFTEALRTERDQWRQSVQDKGYFWDESGQRIVLDPQTRAQLADSTTLVDLTRLHRALGREGYGTTLMQAKGLAAADYGQYIFDAGQQVFRVATLFRPSYILKNSIAEPLMASYIAHGAMASEDGVLNATREFLANSGERFRARSLQAADATGATPYRRLSADVADLHRERIDTERAVESLDASVARAKEKSPAWLAQHWPQLKAERAAVTAKMQQIHRVLDGEDPGWRAADSESTFPSLSSLKADYAALHQGLNDPKHLTKLETRARSLSTRATTAYNAGDLERSADLRRRSIALRETAQKWANLSPEDRAALEVHGQNLAKHIDDLLTKADDPEMATAAARAAAVAERDLITDRLRPLRERQARLAARRELTAHASAAKDVKINTRNGQVMVAGLADPSETSGIMDEFSVHNTQHLVMDPTTLVGSVKTKMQRDGMSTVVKPGEPLYYQEWEHSINRHLRSDPLVRLMLSGESDATIASWLNTPEGVNYSSAMGWKKQSDISERVVPESPLTDYQAEQIDGVRNLVNQYLPTNEIQQQALDAPVRLSHLTSVPVEALPNVSGGSVKVELNRSPVNAINNAMGKVWDLMATHPENYFGRFPYARREYSNALQRRVTFAEEQGMVMTPDAINAMKYAARKEALANVEKTFYTIRRQNNMVAASRFLLSYPAATINSFTRFNRLRWYVNPVRGLREQVVRADIYTHFGVDAEGAPVTDPSKAEHLVFSLPGDGPFGEGNQLTLNTKSLQLVGGDASPNWTVVVPMASFSRANPHVDAAVKALLGPTYENLFPYGTSGQSGFQVGPIALDTMTPGMVKDFVAWSDPNSQRRREFAVTQYKWDYAQWMKAKEAFDNGQGDNPGKAPTPEQATQTAGAFAGAMLLAHAMLPGSAGVAQKGDYGSPEMKAVQAFYNDAYQASQKDPRVQSGAMNASELTAQQMHAQHMDWMYPLLQSTSSSLFSIPSSLDAYDRYKANRDFISEIEARNKKSPQVAGVLFADLPSGVGTSDPNVSRWMQQQDVNGKPLKNPDNVTTYAADMQTELAWQQYERAVAQKDSALAAYGGVNPQTGKPIAKLSDLPDLKAQWTQWVDQFSADPANEGWLNEYKSRNPDKGAAAVRTLTAVLGDPKQKARFAANSPDKSYWVAAEDYLRQRSSVEQRYVELTRTGQTADAAELGVQWDAYVRKNYVASGSFLKMYDRYLGGMDLTSYDSSQKAAS